MSRVVPPDTRVDLQPNLYAGYETWKGWSEPFTVGAEEAAYFAGETRGLAIEKAELMEIGFGSGSFLAWARQRGARIAGTEINGILIEAARSFGVELLPADFERVAHEHAGRFDTIAAFDVFEHFPLAEIVTRLEAAELMLKTGGQMIMRFPNAQSPFGLAPQNGDPTHKTALSRSVLEQLIQGTTFEVVRYAPSFRVSSGSVAKRFGLFIRFALRDMISHSLNAIYAQDIPWDPVVVLVLRKTAR
jgi:2-polyprenyl-3-methyl-5-hydroxy-6-metoxy-1,4-benzoquinol methylase